MRVWMRAPVGTSLTAVGMAKPKGFPRLIVKPIATTDTRDEVQDLARELTADIALYRTAQRASSPIRLRQTFGVGSVIEYDPDMPDGFIIITSYPRID